MYSLHCSCCTNMLFVHILFSINILFYFLGFDSLLKCLWAPVKYIGFFKKNTTYYFKQVPLRGLSSFNIIPSDLRIIQLNSL